MATRRGRSQARRNTGSNSGMPGWAWLVLGLLLGIGAFLAAPRLLKSDGDGFFRPRPNPDAQPAGATADDAIAPEGSDRSDPGAGADKAKEPDFDFYTLLPGEEVAISDAQLAATAREEAARQQRQQREQQSRQAAAQAGSEAAIAAANGALPPPLAPDATPTAAPPASTAAAPTPVASGDARYILQAGAFSASGDAEGLKARIALIGLGARVESASINGKTMYRVRMGPYGTASELAQAKAKLGNSGLPAMAIKVK